MFFAQKYTKVRFCANLPTHFHPPEIPHLRPQLSVFKQIGAISQQPLFPELKIHSNY